MEVLLQTNKIYIQLYEFLICATGMIFFHLSTEIRQNLAEFDLFIGTGGHR